MPTQAQVLEAKWKALIERLAKSPLMVRVAVALAIFGVVYAVLMWAAPFHCLINIFVSLVLLGILWKLQIQGIKQLLVIGVLGSLVVAGFYAHFSVAYYMDIPAQTATSEDGELFAGTVTPQYGTSTTLYNFTVSARLPNATSEISNMTVVIGDLRFYGGIGHNYTMLPAGSHLNAQNQTIVDYYYETTVPHALNLFVFWAKIDGDWYFAGNQNPSSSSPLPTYGIEGPAFKNYGALYGLMLPFGLYAGFVNIYPVFAILVLMVWWLKKARKMRMESYEKAVAEREKAQAEVTKDDAKVPSLAKAMGVEGEDTFVCSECGADVPAEAKSCPKCGEKFD